jgi:hypothetical protein
MAVATCLLEHLLEQGFDTYVAKVRAEILEGHSLLLDTRSKCSFRGRDDANARKARHFVRNARRGRADEG